MFKKHWLKLTFVSIILTISFGIGFLTGTHWQKTPDYSSFEFYEKDGQIYSGIAVPEKLITGNFSQDESNARKLLSQNKKWLYVTSGQVPGFSSHSGFVFRAIASDEETPQQ